MRLIRDSREKLLGSASLLTLNFLDIGYEDSIEERILSRIGLLDHLVSFYFVKHWKRINGEYIVGLSLEGLYRRIINSNSILELATN